MLEKKIFDLRQKLGSKLQPLIMPDLEDLVEKTISSLTGLSVSSQHPYNYSQNLFATLMLNKAYACGCVNCLDSVPDNIYFYRLCSLSSLLNASGRYLPGKEKFKFLNKTTIPVYLAHDEVSLFNRLKLMSKRLGGWMQLSSFLLSYEVPRKFTWWTSFDVKDIASTERGWIETAHKLGIHNDFINKYSILLRCNSKYLTPDKIGIPDSIDAFDSIIFKPTNHVPKHPNENMTINLINFENPGLPEYLFKNVPVDAIEFITVQTNISKDIWEYANYTDLLPKLFNFYQKLV